MAYNRYSNDSALRPLSTANNNRMYEDGQPKKKGISNWIKFGVPVALVVIIAAVVGGVVGSRSSKNNNSSSSSSSNTNDGSSSVAPPNASQLSSINNAVGMFATSTNKFGIPIYPSTTNGAAFGQPTFLSQSNAASSLSWPADPFSPSSPSATTVRTDRPRLIAPAYKWQALPALMEQSPYLKHWHETIMANAKIYGDSPPVPYNIDGGLDKSGVLDVAREVKQRIKVFAYAYRMTNETSWADRAWKELQNACGQGSAPFGADGNNWNTDHFLDVAEFTAAFAIGYDWLYDIWTDEQKSTIRNAIVTLGLKYGVEALANDAGYGWWKRVNGNWNCVCNGGLTMGALAILGDDTTGTAENILTLTVPNAEANCARGPSTDGTWSETPNYWYFGTTGHAELSASLLTATGSPYNLLSQNPNFKKTGLYHMYVFGNQQMFDYGDHGPNKFSTTANSILFYGSQFNTPSYTLFQRDRPDAAEPWSMFWYDPSVSGAWWNDLALDHHFDDSTDDWVSMRSSWTDNSGLFVAMKSSNMTDHQAHGDLDAGDFVIDALGVRWAGELGSGDYLSTGYFSNEDQNSQRWLYYRKRTEGQNTLVQGHANQLITYAPVTKYGSSDTAQGSSTVFSVPSDSTAFYTTDLTSAYGGTSIKRGIRMINGRKQVLLQDDINGSQAEIQWRMHTNATVALSGSSATLTLDGKTMKVSILDAPSGVAFETLNAVRYSDDPAFPPGQTDQENPGVTVLAITLQPGTYSLQVLFNPQWDGMDASAYKIPPTVAVDNWSLTSHN